MHSANIAELKNQLSKYLTFARNGEEVVIRDRELPIAKLVPLSPGEAGEDELRLVAAGKMRLPIHSVEVRQLVKIRAGSVAGSQAVQALLAERAEGL